MTPLLNAMEMRQAHDARCTIYSDGGARGNPGPAAAGVVIMDRDGVMVAELSEYLGIATNNVAEYRALILGLHKALELGFRSVSVRMDSELVVRQLSGAYRVKDDKIRPLHQRAQQLLQSFVEVDVGHVRRSDNKRADELVNAALDARAAQQSHREGE